jgi:hypothetical protein
MNYMQIEIEPFPLVAYPAKRPLSPKAVVRIGESLAL